jgi:hypothetical protein
MGPDLPISLVGRVSVSGSVDETIAHLLQPLRIPLIDSVWWLWTVCGMESG